MWNSVLVSLSIIIAFLLSFSSSEATLQSLVKLGDAALQKGDYQTAIEQYSEAVSLAVSSSEPLSKLYYKRAEVHHLSKQYEHSLSDLEIIIRLNDTHVVQSYRLLGRIQLKLGRIEEALISYSSALLLSPKHKSTLRQIQKCETAKRMIDDLKKEDENETSSSSSSCIDILSELLKKFSPSSTSLRLELATCALKHGSDSLAKRELRKVLEEDPKNAAYALGVFASYLYKHVGLVDEALEYAKKGLSLDPDHKECRSVFKRIRTLEKLLKQGFEFREAGKHRRSAKKFEEYLRFLDDPEHSRYTEIWQETCVEYGAAARDKQLTNITSALLLCDECPEELGRCHLGRVDLLLVAGNLTEAERLVRQVKKRGEGQDYYRQALETEQRVAHQVKLAARKDYYKILGVGRLATTREIKKAYHKLSMIWHPDRAPDDKKQEHSAKFVEVTEAYEILSDEEKRGRYDRGEDLEDRGNPFGGGWNFARPTFTRRGGGGGGPNFQFF